MEKIIEMSHEMNHERNATALMLMEIIIHFAPKARDPPEKGRHVYHLYGSLSSRFVNKLTPL